MHRPAAGLGGSCLLNPPWWTEPITGLVRFFQSNLTRGQTIPIPVQFLGTIYQTPNQSLPWYNTLVWTILVTPVGFLLLGLAGMCRSHPRVQGRTAGPVDPGKLGPADRLAGLAAHARPRRGPPVPARLRSTGLCWSAWVQDRSSTGSGPWARIAVAAAVVEAIGSVLLFLPVPLSYYSPLVGGLPGAARLGMEPTYYWDGLNPEARQWLRENTLPGQTIRFATFPTSWLYLRQTGELPRRLDPVDRGQPAWYVHAESPGRLVANRSAACRAFDPRSSWSTSSECR